MKLIKKIFSMGLVLLFSGCVKEVPTWVIDHSVPQIIEFSSLEQAVIETEKKDFHSFSLLVPKKYDTFIEDSESGLVMLKPKETDKDRYVVSTSEVDFVIKADGFRRRFTVDLDRTLEEYGIHNDEQLYEVTSMLTHANVKSRFEEELLEDKHTMFNAYELEEEIKFYRINNGSHTMYLVCLNNGWNTNAKMEFFANNKRYSIMQKSMKQYSLDEIVTTAFLMLEPNLNDTK